MHTFHVSCGMPWLMLLVVGRSCFPEAHKPCLIDRVVYQYWYCPANAHMTQVMYACLWWHCIPFVDVTCKIRTNHIRCVKVMSYIGCIWPTFPEWCMQSITDVAQSKPMVNVRKPWMMLHSTGQYRLGVARMTQLMPSSRCAHATTHVCKLWIILPLIGQCPLADVRMPLLMRSNHGWSHPSNVHRIQLMRTGFI